MNTEIKSNKKTKRKPMNPWVKFAIYAVIYLLFVIWLQNWWLLLGLPIIFDFCITKKVNWTFWKKRGVERQTKLIEWVGHHLCCYRCHHYPYFLYRGVYYSYIVDGKIAVGW